MIKINLIKLGNHWYPDLNHKKVSDLKLDDKIEKYINHTNKYGYYSPTIYIYELGSVIPDKNVLRFKDEDINDYKAGEDFDLIFDLNNHKFKISSSLIYLLEQQFNIDIANNLYKIEIW